MKKFVALLSMIVILLLPLPAAAQASSEPVQIIVNGQLISSDTAPFIENGRTYVPVRFVGEALGYDVRWTNPFVVLTDNNSGVIMSLQPGDRTLHISYATKSDKEIIQLPPNESMLLRNYRSFLPIRVVAEATGSNVEWANGVINISSAREPVAYNEDPDLAKLIGTSFRELRANYSENVDPTQQVGVGRTFFNKNGGQFSVGSNTPLAERPGDGETISQVSGNFSTFSTQPTNNNLITPQSLEAMFGVSFPPIQFEGMHYSTYAQRDEQVIVVYSRYPTLTTENSTVWYEPIYEFGGNL